MNEIDEIEFEKLERAAMIARKIDADFEKELDEEEEEYLRELSGRSEKEFKARLHAQRWLSKRRRERKEEEDSKFLFAILVWVCKIDPQIAAGLCMVQHTPTFL